MNISVDNCPFHKSIIPYIDGKCEKSAREIDTENSYAMVFDGIKDSEIVYVRKCGKITFKLKRGSNIPEPFFSRLTIDIGFAGFEE